MTVPERLRLLLVQGGAPRPGPPAPGAAGRALWEVATRLPASRYAVSAWLPPDPGLDELARSLADREVAVERAADSRRGLDLEARLGAWRRLRRSRPGLIHLHLDDHPAWDDLPLLARLAGSPPLVVSQHGLPGAGTWRLLGRAAAVTVSCRAAGERLAREHRLPRRRLQVVPFGADPPDEEAEQPAAAQQRQRFGAGTFRPLWVSAGRLERPKGHDVMIEALGRLRDRGLDFVVALAGEGPLRPALQRLAAERGLGDRVHFLGDIESPGPLLRAANAVVLPAREEALPLLLLEAMSRGRPLVASRVGGIPDVVEHGVHGLLVPAEDPEALAAALALLHEKQDLARHMGLAARERVRDGFTWAHAVGGYEAVYDEVLGLAGFPSRDHR